MIDTATKQPPMRLTRFHAGGTPASGFPWNNWLGCRQLLLDSNSISYWVDETSYICF